MCPWIRVVYFAALQQIIFNADRSASERMIRDRSRTSPVLASILVTYVLREIPGGGEAPPFIRGRRGSAESTRQSATPAVSHLMSAQLG